MGITAMIPDMTIGQLTQEASTRWGEIWDPNATRMRILLLCPRKERKMMELHGDMVEHGQPVMAVFHRPRAEAPLLEEQGFDTRAASFQFVDISTPDLGPWMQHMVSNEGWIRGSIEIASTPFSVGLPSQRPFETERTLYFRHPSLPALERYYLPFPVESLPGKCFVSLPRRAAAEMRNLNPRPNVSDCSVTSFRFGKKRRRVLLLAWLTLLPVIGPFPVNSQRRDMILSSSIFV